MWHPGSHGAAGDVYAPHVVVEVATGAAWVEIPWAATYSSHDIPCSGHSPVSCPYPSLDWENTTLLETARVDYSSVQAENPKQLAADCLGKDPRAALLGNAEAAVHRFSLISLFSSKMGAYDGAFMPGHNRLSHTIRLLL